MAIKTDIFKASTPYSFCSAGAMLLIATAFHLLSVITTSRVWCFKQIVFDLAGDGLDKTGTTCMYPTSGFSNEEMEKALAWLIDTANKLSFDPISQGKDPKINRLLRTKYWDGQVYKYSRSRFRLGWIHLLWAEVAAVLVGYLLFLLVSIRPIRKCSDVMKEYHVLIVITTFTTLSTGAGLVHCGYGYWSLGGISNSELNFFFAMTEYFWLSWSFGTAGFVLGISGATLAIIHVRRDLDKLDDDPERTREAFLDKLKRDKLQRDKQKLAAKNKNYDDDDDDERYERPSEKETWRINI